MFGEILGDFCAGRRRVKKFVEKLTFVEQYSKKIFVDIYETFVGQ